jgi:hypothetical protein
MSTNLYSFCTLSFDIAAVDALTHVIHDSGSRAAIDEDTVNPISVRYLFQNITAHREPHNHKPCQPCFLHRTHSKIHSHISQTRKHLLVHLIQPLQHLTLLTPSLQPRLFFRTLLALDFLLAEARMRAQDL